MLFRRNEEAWLYVRLFDNDANPVTGMTVANLFNGGAYITLLVSGEGAPVSPAFPGVSATIPLVDGDSWIEIIGSPGLYAIRLEAAFFQKWVPWGGRASISWSVLSADSEFAAEGFSDRGVVEDLPQHMANWNIQDSRVRTGGHAERLWRQFMSGRVFLDETTNTRTVKHEDGVRELSAVDTKNDAGDPATDPIYETVEIPRPNPVVTAVSPVDLGAGPAMGPVILTFSKDMHGPSLTDQPSFVIRQVSTGERVDGVVSIVDATHAQFVPTIPFTIGEVYQVVATNDSVDFAGYPLEPFVSTFTAVSGLAPQYEQIQGPVLSTEFVLAVYLADVAQHPGINVFLNGLALVQTPGGPNPGEFNVINTLGPSETRIVLNNFLSAVDFLAIEYMTPTAPSLWALEPVRASFVGDGVTATFSTPFSTPPALFDGVRVWRNGLALRKTGLLVAGNPDLYSVTLVGPNLVVSFHPSVAPQVTDFIDIQWYRIFGADQTLPPFNEEFTDAQPLNQWPLGNVVPVPMYSTVRVYRNGLKMMNVTPAVPATLDQYQVFDDGGVTTVQFAAGLTPTDRVYITYRI